MTPKRPPDRIETERLVLRCWRPEDAPRVREAIDLSLAELRPWLPWAPQEPRTLAETRAQLAAFRARFKAGEDYTYGVFGQGETRVIGGTGFHLRIGPGGMEIGYWVRSDETGKGYATEATRTLTRLGLALEGINRIQIRCDPQNAASRRIPERLGFTLLEIVQGTTTGPDGDLRDTAIYQLSDPGQLAP